MIPALKSNPQKPTSHFFSKDSCENWEFEEENGESIGGIGLYAYTHFSSSVAKYCARDSCGSRLQGTSGIMIVVSEASFIFVYFLLFQVVACAGWDEERYDGPEKPP